MKLAKKAGCARGSGLLYKDICWLLSLGRPGREEPGSETCKEIETTRRLLKEHSTQTLTASHSEHEAIKTWSGKLPSLYFTQQENLGCPGWQNNIRPPKSSQGLSHFVQAYYSAGTQNIQHRPDWNFHCYCEVLADKKKKILYFDGAVLNMLSAYVRCAASTSPGRWQIGVCLGWQWHACRQVCLHASLHDVCALCGRWRQRPASGGPCAAARLPGETRHGAALQMSSQIRQQDRPESRNTAARAFHLTGPDHWT